MKRMLLTCLTLLMLLVVTSCGEDSGTSPVEESSYYAVPTPSAGNATAQSHADNGQEPEETTSLQSEEPSPDAAQTSTVSSKEDKTDGKTLIAYFSLIDIVPEGADASTHATPSIGNTQSAAMEIQSQVGGDLFAIQTVQIYPVNHSECSAIAEDEMRSDARPELSTHVENMDGYDTVYIGYPLWWYIEPMAIRTFLEEYDFSGKTVIPFCTSLGAGITESEVNIASLAEEANVLEGITLRTEQENMSGDIASWLADIGMAN